MSQNESKQKNKRKKNTQRVITALIFLTLIILLIFAIIKKRTNQSAETNTAQTEKNTDSTAGLGSTEEGSIDGSAESEDVSEGVSIDITDYTSQMNYETALEEGAIEIDSNSGETYKKIGNFTIKFNADNAISGSLTLDDYTADVVLYNDGNEDDLKSVIAAIPAFKNAETPSTIETCQDILGEYIPDGTGTTAEWEETTYYYIRKVSGYDTDDKCAVICYALVPKNKSDDNVYFIVLTASKADDVITPLSEESYNSMLDPVKDFVTDSTLLPESYDAAKKELKDLAYYETSNGEAMGGLYQLRKWAKEYEESVYGENADELTEDEKKELFWKHIDQEGYEETQAKENEVVEEKILQTDGPQD